MATRKKLLGIAASLRNARHRPANPELVQSLQGIQTEAELFAFLADQSEQRLEQFVQAGRKDGLSFLEIYRNLKRLSGRKGLSNSEVALAAALWSAHREGVAIDYLSLAGHFDASGRALRINELRDRLLEADGLLVSGPVYFGDRGSLAQALVDLLRSDRALREGMRDRLYAGIAVGAKRNGGQETTLIYQMLDFLRCGFMGVGNDSQTTAQYGGTGHAGDVGTMHKDLYGLQTSMGTGRRLAALMRPAPASGRLAGPVKVLFLVLQDRRGEAMALLERFLAPFAGSVEATLLDVSRRRILPCLACDICPTRIGPDEHYRCIIQAAPDELKLLHGMLLHHDAIVPVTLSVEDPGELESVYQLFIERTRYLRRGDYALSDQLVAPLAFEELGFGENYGLRMMTSMLRHHTVLYRPMTGYLQGDALCNEAGLAEAFGRFLQAAGRLAGSRLGSVADLAGQKYHPVGYTLSALKDAEDEQGHARRELVLARQQHLLEEGQARLAP